MESPKQTSVVGEQREREYITEAEGEVARMKEWLTVSGNTESYNK